MEEKEQVLQARIEALQADNDFTNERLAALQGTHTHKHTQTHVRAGVLPPVLVSSPTQELCETTPLETLTVGQHISALVVVYDCLQCG